MTHPFTKAILDTMNRPEPEESERLEEQTAAMVAAIERRILSAREMPGLGEIRANRSIPIRSRKHSVSHKALR